jgi:hypothetical protein
MMFVRQMGKDMFPYNKIEKNKMRLFRSVAVTVTMMMMINRKEK